MEVLWGSALLVAVTVLLCEGARIVCRRKLRPGLALELAFEAVSTLQLCCCVRELALLGSRGDLDPALGLGLTYLFTVLQSFTAQAACNPCSSLQLWLRGEATGEDTALRVGAQFVGAQVSRMAMPALWAFGLSPLHLEGAQETECESPLSIDPLSGACFEMFCALCLFILLRNLDRLEAQLRPHLVAMLITSLVYAGGHLTGAVFNPALAFSLLFSCEGNSLLEYIFVYWLGPVIGLILSILLLDGRIAIFSPVVRIADGRKYR